MGTVIKTRSVHSTGQTGMMKPIIYCNPGPELSADAVSINIGLAQKLEKLKPKRRSMKLEGCFNEILNSLPDNPVIKDFDVMFNPYYQIDILKIMITACKRKTFSLIWPGSYEDGRLIYAEEGYSDYKVYPISDYDITCIVQEDRQ